MSINYTLFSHVLASKSDRSAHFPPLSRHISRNHYTSLSAGSSQDSTNLQTKTLLTCVPGLLALILILAVTGAPVHAASSPDVSTICIESDSGLVLSEENASVRRPPASMVKMMLMLLVVEGIERGDWTLDTEITTSRYAQSVGGCQVWLSKGDTHPLGKLMNAVAVASANDAAAAVADGLWGDVASYLEVANARAAELGMTETEIHSVHGLPPGRGQEFDRTTARDMTALACVCVEKPVLMSWVGQKAMRFRPKDAIRHNTNKLLWKMDACDGLKTGYIRAAGFCLTATAMRDGVRLVAVVMGAPSKNDRFRVAQRILENGFSEVQRLRVVSKGENVGGSVPVPRCESHRLQLAAQDDVWVTVRNADIDKLEVLTTPAAEMPPAYRLNAPFGEVRVLLAGRVLASTPLAIPFMRNDLR